MKAVILAAGMGTRLGDKTANSPKCLIDIYGKPLIYYSLMALKKNNINEAIFIVGYLSDRIKEVIGDSFHGMPIRYINNSQFDHTGSELSLFLAAPVVKNESFLILESDLLYDPFFLKALFLARIAMRFWWQTFLNQVMKSIFAKIKMGPFHIWEKAPRILLKTTLSESLQEL